MHQGLIKETLLQKKGEIYLPLFQYSLKRANNKYASDGLDSDRLQSLRKSILARNALFFAELKKILIALGEDTIEVILLKGAMMEGIYPPGLRPFNDIDILIRKEHLERVKNRLISLGYIPHHSRLPVGLEDTLGEVLFAKAGRLPVPVEPHWTLGPLLSHLGKPEIDVIWKSAQKAKIWGLDTLIMSPENSLLHACLHLFHHYKGNWLCSACDIAEIARYYNERIDWSVFLKQASDFKVCLPVRYSLEKTAALFGDSIPSFVLARLAAYRTGKFERLIFTPLANSDRMGTFSLATFWKKEGIRPKLRYIRAQLFPGREYIIECYSLSNSRLWPLYSVFRLIKAARLAFGTLINILQTILRR